jgi:hypothetical protein
MGASVSRPFDHRCLFKKLWDTYHSLETGKALSRVRRFRYEGPIREEMMIPQKTDALTCVLVVTAALLLGFVRCNGRLSEAP